MQMTEFIRAFPPAAPIIGDLLAKNLDWPGADEIAKRLESINPANQNKIPPEVQQMIQQGQQAIQELTQKVQQLEADRSVDMMNAETKRLQVVEDTKTDRVKIAVDAQTKIEGQVVSAQARMASQNPMRQG